jgi:hypothetical protein
MRVIMLFGLPATGSTGELEPFFEGLQVLLEASGGEGQLTAFDDAGYDHGERSLAADCRIPFDDGGQAAQVVTDRQTVEERVEVGHAREEIVQGRLVDDVGDWRSVTPTWGWSCRRCRRWLRRASGHRRAPRRERRSSRRSRPAV